MILSENLSSSTAVDDVKLPPRPTVELQSEQKPTVNDAQHLPESETDTLIVNQHHHLHHHHLRKQTEQITQGINYIRTSLLFITKWLESHSLSLDRIFFALLGLDLVIVFLILISPYTNYNPLPFTFLPPGNWKVQMANLSLLVSYLSPNILFLRIVIAMAGFWFVLWGATIKPYPLGDTIFWNTAMMLINIRMATQLFYAMRPIQFSPVLERVYVGVFKGIMSRSFFQTLTKGALVRDIAPGRFYAQPGDTIAGLSILVTGKMKVVLPSKAVRKALKQAFMQIHEEEHNRTVENSQVQVETDGDIKKLVFEDIDDADDVMTDFDMRDFRTGRRNKTKANEAENEVFLEELNFMDSPEWFLRGSKEASKFVVGLQAITECKYVYWPGETLDDILEKNPMIKQTLLGVLGIDVSRKIFNTN